jgi:hypothetical protein
VLFPRNQCNKFHNIETYGCWVKTLPKRQGRPKQIVARRRLAQGKNSYNDCELRFMVVEIALVAMNSSRFLFDLL